jgi:hypothetical protein
VLTVTAPDGTTTTPTVTVDGSNATAAVPATIAGQYLLVWTVTGTLTDAVMDQFTATPAALGLISLSDLRDTLNIAPSDTTGNAKLRRFIQSATKVVEHITGPMLGQSCTEYFDGNRPMIVLSARWIQSITTITEVLGTTLFTLTEQPLGGSYTQYGYTWDKSTNTIIRRSSGITFWFPPGDRNVTVTYEAGISPLPQDISDAAGDIIQHWWDHGQQAFAAPYITTDEGDVPVSNVMGYAIPNAAVEKLEPYALGPSVG